MKIIDLIMQIILFMLTSGLLYSAIDYARAHTRNQRLKVLETYALQAVATVQDLNQGQYQASKQNLIDLISKSPLNLKVSNAQLDSLIELANKQLKGGN